MLKKIYCTFCARWYLVCSVVFLLIIFFCYSELLPGNFFSVKKHMTFLSYAKGGGGEVAVRNGVRALLRFLNIFGLLFFR